MVGSFPEKFTQSTEHVCFWGETSLYLLSVLLTELWHSVHDRDERSGECMMAEGAH